jgi:hypothetical protein
MKSEHSPGEINFWRERNVPIQQIIQRIHERSNDECVTAHGWLHGWFPDSELGYQISDMADMLRSTEKIMSFLKFDAGNIPPREKALMMELSALAAESAARTAEKLFPRNN